MLKQEKSSDDIIQFAIDVSSTLTLHVYLLLEHWG